MIETTQEILVRVHTLHLQTMHDMGSMQELDRTRARALMAEFVRLQLTIGQDLTRSLIALRINMETSSEAFLSEVATLREAVLKMEGRDIGVGPVAHDVLPSGVHQDYDMDFKTRGVSDIASVLTPSLLSSLVDNIHGLEKPEVPTQPIPSKAEDGMGGHGWIPLKSEAPGPSHNVGATPQTPVSKGEVSKHEPLDQGMSQRDQLVFQVNPEVVAEVIVSDDDDLDLTLKEPQAISMPASEPAPCRKQSPDDQDPPSPPSRKCATKEEGMSTPHQEEALPKGVRLEDILPNSLAIKSGLIG